MAVKELLFIHLVLRSESVGCHCYHFNKEVLGYNSFEFIALVASECVLVDVVGTINELQYRILVLP